MTASPDDLFAYLDRRDIPVTTHWHEPVFTVEEGAEIKAALPGGHTKNLFLKDKSGALILISAEGQTQIRLNKLHKLIGTKRLSFGPADLLLETLGVVPGSVTAFALMNDVSGRIRFLLDAALMRHDIINFHPLTNTGTTAIKREDFKRFLTATGHELEMIDFSEV